jgi:MFS family permease
MSEFVVQRLAPFKSLNFSLFFFARLFSLVGRWSHELARSWLIIEMTGSSQSLGTVMLASSIVVGFFILKGGALVDRGDAKRIMVVTQLLMGFLVLALALFCEWGDVKLWHLVAFALAEGLVMSYDSPTFLAVVVRLVKKEDFQQAMALNSINFHIGRMLGPVLAGGMLAFWGPSAVFFLDAIGFFVVSFIVYLLKVSPTPPRKDMNRAEGLKLSYFYKDQRLRYMLGQLFIAMVTIFPMFVTVLRTFAVSKFSLTSAEFGQLFMYPAMGSVLGSVAFAVWKPKNPLSAVQLGIPLVFCFYFLLPNAPTILLLSVLMSLMGFAAYLMFAAITVGLQLDVEEEFRGRVSSLIGLAFGCIGPFASFPVGAMADRLGEPNAIYICSTVFLCSSAVWYFSHFKVISYASSLEQRSRQDS